MRMIRSISSIFLLVFFLFSLSTYCVFAASTFIATGTGEPNNYFFLTGEGNGTTWSFVKDQQIELPPSWRIYSVASPSCTGRTCIAAGSAFNAHTSPLFFIN